MIIESVPVFPSRPDTSDTAGSERRSTASGDDAFGRTLNDVLTTDRSHRSEWAARPDRPGPEQADSRRSRAAEDRDGRSDGGEDNDERPRNERPHTERRSVAATDQDRGERTTDHKPRIVEGDDTATDDEQPSSGGLERAVDRLSELQGAASDHPAETGLTTALAQLTEQIRTDVNPDADVDTDTSSNPNLNADLIPDIAADLAVNASDASVDATAGAGTQLENLVPVDGDVAGPEPGITADGAQPPAVDGAPVADPGDGSPNPIDDPQPGGRLIADVARDHRGTDLGEVVAEMIATAGAVTGTKSRAAAGASAIAAVATTRTRPATGSSNDGALPVAETSTAGNETEIVVDTGDIELPSLPADEPTADGGDGAQQEPADPSTGFPVEQPSSTPLGLGSERAAVTGAGPTPVASTRPAEAPTPEMVELNTSGLAERLRPAFAAVRRGLNGMDELRLRIQDDNAGPIKVDIATVDNRIRVLLSAGNDDLMRQLGQERDRLADELRRAGFDQASIDIAADHDSGHRARYEGDGTAPNGTVSGSGPRDDAIGTGELAPSTARGRQTTGLDLDL